MINSEVFIIKRDGKTETFSLDKIKNAIAKAFLSVGSFATQDVITTVLSRVSVRDGMNVEEIQKEFITGRLERLRALDLLKPLKLKSGLRLELQKAHLTLQRLMCMEL